MGFEPTISAGERPKTYALDRAATGTGINAVIAKPYTTYMTVATTAYKRTGTRLFRVLRKIVTRENTQFVIMDKKS